MLKLLDHTLIMVLNGANSIIVLETEMYAINNSLRLLLFMGTNYNPALTDMSPI